MAINQQEQQQKQYCSCLFDSSSNNSSSSTKSFIDLNGSEDRHRQHRHLPFLSRSLQSVKWRTSCCWFSIRSLFFTRRPKLLSLRSLSIGGMAVVGSVREKRLRVGKDWALNCSFPTFHGRRSTPFAKPLVLAQLNFKPGGLGKLTPSREQVLTLPRAWLQPGRLSHANISFVLSRERKSSTRQRLRQAWQIMTLIRLLRATHGPHRNMLNAPRLLFQKLWEEQSINCRWCRVRRSRTNLGLI